MQISWLGYAGPWVWQAGDNPAPFFTGRWGRGGDKGRRSSSVPTSQLGTQPLRSYLCVYFCPRSPGW